MTLQFLCRRGRTPLPLHTHTHTTAGTNGPTNITKMVFYRDLNISLHENIFLQITWAETDWYQRWYYSRVWWAFQNRWMLDDWIYIQPRTTTRTQKFPLKYPKCFEEEQTFGFAWTVPLNPRRSEKHLKPWTGMFPQHRLSGSTLSSLCFFSSGVMCLKITVTYVKSRIHMKDTQKLCVKAAAICQFWQP